jgi:hypothetical protein
MQVSRHFLIVKAKRRKNETHFYFYSTSVPSSNRVKGGVGVEVKQTGVPVIPTRPSPATPDYSSGTTIGISSGEGTGTSILTGSASGGGSWMCVTVSTIRRFTVSVSITFRSIC